MLVSFYLHGIAFPPVMYLYFINCGAVIISTNQSHGMAFPLWENICVTKLANQSHGITVANQSIGMTVSLRKNKCVPMVFLLRKSKCLTKFQPIRATEWQFCWAELNKVLGSLASGMCAQFNPLLVTMDFNVVENYKCSSLLNIVLLTVYCFGCSRGHTEMTNAYCRFRPYV